MPPARWPLKHGNVKPMLEGFKPLVESMKSSSKEENTRTLTKAGLLRKYRPLVKYVSKDSEQRLWVDTIDDIDRPRHLLRALLRECTYLPDPICKVYVQSYVLSRFRSAKKVLSETGKQSRSMQPPKGRVQDQASHQSTEEGSATPFSGQEKIASEALTSRKIKTLRDGRTGLKILQDANRGISEALTRVLFFGYGRIGKRRHELLAPLRRQAEGGGDFMAQTSKLAGLREERQTELPSIPPKLEALLRSQKANRPAGFNIKSLDPGIPKENSWGRAMPQNRTKNLLIDWFKTRISKVLPPLPDEEWEYVGKIATGEIKLQIPIARRERAETMPAWFYPQVSKPLAIVESMDSSDPDKLLDVLQHRELKDALQGLDGMLGRKSPKSAAHNYTRRFMRRRYTELFELCPKLLWDEDKQQWKYEWGQLVRRKGNNKRQALSTGDELFRIRTTEELDLEEGNRRLDKHLTLGSKEGLYGGLGLD